MPCEYYGRGERDRHLANVLRRELGDATRILCAWCTEEEESGGEVPEVAKRWWARHQMQDEERRISEANARRVAKESEDRRKARKKLLDSLSEEERALITGKGYQNDP